MTEFIEGEFIFDLNPAHRYTIDLRPDRIKNTMFTFFIMSLGMRHLNMLKTSFLYKNGIVHSRLSYISSSWRR